VTAPPDEILPLYRAIKLVGVLAIVIFAAGIVEFISFEPPGQSTGAVARITGKEPFLTADALRMSRYHMFFSSDKAKRDLGYQARPYREGLKDALGWFRENGYLK